MYLAQDTLLRRKVAIKFPSDASALSAHLLEEARAAGRLDHPHIARVYEAGVADDGRLFVVMEYVPGKSLAETLKEGRLPLERVREVMGEILDALAEAHRHDIVHRDIKPQNIIIASTGAVKVVDFGLAKRAAALANDETHTIEVTEVGVIKGTLAYMSPEQLRGEPVDGRSDLYSCGVVLYECITGRKPFEGHGLVLMNAILHSKPGPVTRSREDAGATLDAVVQRALAKTPEGRFQTAKEMAEAIRPGKASAVPLNRARLSRRMLVGAAVAIGVCLGTWYATRPEDAVVPASAARWYQQGLEALRDGAYYNAARAFERVTETNSSFALGRARLAEAYMELDWPERAQRELLLAKRVSPGWRRPSPVIQYTLAAVEDLVLRDYSGAMRNYEALLRMADQRAMPGAWLDFGRAQERAGENRAAANSYTEAIRLDPDHAAPWLLRGLVWGALQDFEQMRSDFQKARSIYEVSQNLEGQSALAYEEGRIATMAKDLPVARAALERAVELGRKTGSEFHEVRALTQLSIVTYMEGNAAEAQKLSGLAVTRARGARMPFLTVQGLVDLGNAQLSRLDLQTAEVTLREAIALAMADRLPRSEARARMSLGSVLVQAARDEEAIREIEAALKFYSKGQFRSVINMGRVLLGRVYRRRGEFAQVHRLLEETLSDAKARGDTAKAADTLQEIANVYTTEEKFVEALKHFEERLELVRNSKASTDVGYSLTGKASMLLHLGLFDEAQAALAEAIRRAGTNESVARRVKTVERDALYRRGQWAQCAAAYQEAMRERQTNVEEEGFAVARRIECLAFSGRAPEARTAAVSGSEWAGSKKGTEAAAWLRVAAALAGPSAREADSLAESVDYFRKRGQLESLWMAEAVAARASRRNGDTPGAARHAEASGEALRSFEKRLDEAYRSKYGLSPVVMRFRRVGDER